MTPIEAILEPYDLDEIISSEPEFVDEWRTTLLEEYPKTRGLASVLEKLYIKSIEKFYQIKIHHVFLGSSFLLKLFFHLKQSHFYLYRFKPKLQILFRVYVIMD